MLLECGSVQDLKKLIWKISKSSNYGYVKLLFSQLLVIYQYCYRFKINLKMITKYKSVLERHVYFFSKEKSFCYVWKKIKNLTTIYKRNYCVWNLFFSLGLFLLLKSAWLCMVVTLILRLKAYFQWFLMHWAIKFQSLPDIGAPPWLPLSPTVYQGPQTALTNTYPQIHTKISR